MSAKYKIGENLMTHFVTSTVVGWVDVFSREIYKEIVVDSLAYCQKEKGLILHAWVIMTNHIHLIISSETNSISNIMRDFKKYTSKKIIADIEFNTKESRKDWLLNMFKYAGAGNSGNKEYQFWKNEFHPVTLDTPEKLAERLHYLHFNPVRAGIVWTSEGYKYSSAIDYYTNTKGLLQIALI
ncbi:MAG TPA: transposase [Chitinophagaceae bacterium]|nr:transposase [Chitinophagaceae bacterium]